jgi:hypothetical protein
VGASIWAFTAYSRAVYAFIQHEPVSQDGTKKEEHEAVVGCVADDDKKSNNFQQCGELLELNGL